MKKFVLLFLVLFVNLAVVPDRLFSAHRFHTSLTRIDHNSEQKNLEITIQLFTHDLEDVFGKERKSKRGTETEAEFDKWLLSYLEKNLIIKNNQDHAQKLSWVGKETKADLTFVYVEVKGIENLESYKFQNTIFFESYKEQTNLVAVRYNGVKSDFLFKRGDKFQTVERKQI